MIKQNLSKQDKNVPLHRIFNNTLYNNNMGWHQIYKHKKSIYVFMWAIISLVSSYSSIIKGDFSFIEIGDFQCDIIAPLLMWTVAFFADYIYTISMVNPKNEELDKSWTQKTYISICFIFIILTVSSYHNDSVIIRIIWITLLFYNIIRLKVASLNIIRPRIAIKTV